MIRSMLMGDIMSIGILYESDEWSNRRMSDCLNQRGIQTEMIFVEDVVIDPECEFPHLLYINRVFPSADMRGNTASIQKMEHLLNLLTLQEIHVINSQGAFLYDCSKWKTYTVLKKKGYKIPELVHINAESIHKIDTKELKFPMVAKRDCGGRSYDMQIIRTADAMIDFIRNIYRTNWVFQEFVEPIKGYTTRVEVIDNEIMAVLKRFIGRSGISSYSMGSRYEIYEDCPSGILEDSITVLNALGIEMGSLDFIESGHGMIYLIDVNATSNFTLDYVPLLGFDPIEKMVEYIFKEYNIISTGEEDD